MPNFLKIPGIKQSQTIIIGEPIYIQIQIISWMTMSTAALNYKVEKNDLIRE